MAINSNNAASPFGLPNFAGLDMLSETADRVNEIGAYLGSSPIYQSDIANFGYLITLNPLHPLPSVVPTGSIAVSGSNANTKLYIYVGAATLDGWVLV